MNVKPLKKPRKSRKVKSINKEEGRSNEGNDGGNIGKGSKKGTKSTTERNEPKEDIKKNRKDNESTVAPSKEPIKVKGQESEDVKDKGQTSKCSVSDKKTGTKHNKVKSKRKRVNVKTRVRTQKEYGETMSFLAKRLYFSKTQKETDKYQYMMDKVERESLIV